MADICYGVMSQLNKCWRINSHPYTHDKKEIQELPVCISIICSLLFRCLLYSVIIIPVEWIHSVDVSTLTVLFFHADV